MAVAKINNPNVTESVPTAIEIPNTELESTIRDDQEIIRSVAYRLWRARGCPIGSPEVDWFAAEGQMRNTVKAATIV